MLNNPELRIRKRIAIEGAVAVVLVVAALVYARVGPSDLNDSERLETSSPKAVASRPAADSIDAHAFDKILWNPIVKKPSVTSPNADGSSHVAVGARFQLLGISKENGVLHAAIYDSKDDRLYLAPGGSKLAEYELTKINGRDVILQNGSDEVRLALSEEVK